MDIGTIRDIIISILGILYILLTIGIIVGLVIAYIKLRHLFTSVNRTVYKVHRGIAYVQGLAKGLNESMNAFKRGGL